MENFHCIIYAVKNAIPPHQVGIKRIYHCILFSSDSSHLQINKTKIYCIHTVTKTKQGASFPEWPLLSFTSMAKHISIMLRKLIVYRIIFGFSFRLWFLIWWFYFGIGWFRSRILRCLWCCGGLILCKAKNNKCGSKNSIILWFKSRIPRNWEK